MQHDPDQTLSEDPGDQLPPDPMQTAAEPPSLRGPPAADATMPDPTVPDPTVPDAASPRAVPQSSARHPFPAHAAARPGHKLPARIGPYRVLDLLGEGGMGQVLKAEQLKPVRRVVALKVIKLGMDSREVVARFEAERQALALMDHPSVAKVYDAGVTDRGQPYFAMELVAGVPLTDYCDAHQLPTRRRLALFAEVCHAVQHAHQKGIIHRDLKPGNVLVGEVDGKPVPKVIDFGIAKATGEAEGASDLVTRGGVAIGTLAYMSPEQAAGSLDIDTRTDVYSLGVVLYELLTGELPLDPDALRSAGLEGAVRIIRESEPARPSTRIGSKPGTRGGAGTGNRPGAAGSEVWARESHRDRPWRADARTLHRELSGDLDWITLKAMEKDRSRRYETANALAADVHRHLDDEPVSARPPTLSYRVGKLARRHKAAVATVVAVAVALVAGMAGTTYGFIRARAERDNAVAAHQAEVRERDRAERAERDRKLQLVDELIAASPEAVPPIVESLRALPDLVTPPLRRKFEDAEATPQQRLRAACALAACEKAPPDDKMAGKPVEDVLQFLLDQVLSAPAPESENVIAALRYSGPFAIDGLKTKGYWQLTPDVMRRVPNLSRYSFTLLSLGTPTGVDILMKGRADDTGRTAAIHTYASWHGDLAPACAYVRAPGTPPESRGGLCAALGTLDPASLRTDEQKAVADVLAWVFLHAPDSGSHGAAGWALRKWELPLPDVPRTDAPVAGRDWFVNLLGMTMLRLPDYKFVPAEDVLPAPPPGKSYTLGNVPFFICDCETTIAAFEEFANAAGLPEDERLVNWKGPDPKVGPTPDCPVQQVHLDDAIRFCNWLSRHEHRKPYYVRKGSRWGVNPGAGGYRLPSGGEWECACRAGTTATLFPFGDDPRYLMDYAVIGEVRELPCGSKQPNAWGLFDMLGNAWEMTWQNATGGTPSLQDLGGGDQPIGGGIVMRGGSYDGGTAYAKPGVLVPEPVDRRADSVGFRVVFTAPVAAPATRPGPVTAPPGR